MVSEFMKTRDVEVKGKARWAHLIQLNKFGAWSIELFPDKDSLEIIRELNADGMKNVPRKDPEDGWYVRFRRDPTKKIRGAIVNFAAPLVIDTEGNKIDTEIGNGSDVTVTLEVYSHKTPSGGSAVAARLKAVRVDNLIPYVRDYTPEQQEVVDRLVAAPPHQEEYWT
jgi:hypothetical protein